MNGFENITKSASKLVLLTLIGVVAVLSIIAGIHDVLAGQFSEVTKVILLAFTNALTFVLGFYFNYKGSEGETTTETITGEGGTSSVTKTTPAFLGK